MKNTAIANIFLLSSLSLGMLVNAHADYVMSIPLNNKVIFKEASNTGGTLPPEPTILNSSTEWENSGIVSCNSWTPSPSTVTAGTAFSQTGSNCSQDQIRQYEEYYIDSSNNKITTNSETQHQSISVASGTRSAVGTQAEYMFSTDSPKYGYFCRVSGNGYGAGYYFYEETIYWNDVQVFIQNIQSNTNRCVVQSGNNNYIGTDGTYRVNVQNQVKRTLR